MSASLDLDAIRKRSGGHPDVAALLAEVERLAEYVSADGHLAYMVWVVLTNKSRATRYHLDPECVGLAAAYNRFRHRTYFRPDTRLIPRTRAREDGLTLCRICLHHATTEET